MPRNDQTTAVLILVAAGVLLLVACAASLWSGKTVGLYGVTESRSTPFYWILVVTYGGLGVLCLLFALRVAFR